MKKKSGAGERGEMVSFTAIHNRRNLESGRQNEKVYLPTGWELLYFMMMQVTPRERADFRRNNSALSELIDEIEHNVSAPAGKQREPEEEHYTAVEKLVGLSRADFMGAWRKYYEKIR